MVPSNTFDLIFSKTWGTAGSFITEKRTHHTSSGIKLAVWYTAEIATAATVVFGAVSDRSKRVQENLQRVKRWTDHQLLSANTKVIHKSNYLQPGVSVGLSKSIFHDYIFLFHRPESEIFYTGCISWHNLYWVVCRLFCVFTTLN